MKVMCSGLIYLCLIFGSRILCDRKLERRQAVSSCSIYTEDKFYCSNGLCIEWSLVCDGVKDCTDGLDETKELCARYEYGTNMTIDCGRANIKNQELDKNKTAVETLPWNVQVYRLNITNFIYSRLCDGSIIAPNVVISGSVCFGFHGKVSNKISVKIGEFKVAVGKYDKNISKIDTEFSQIMNVETIYLNEGYNMDDYGDIAVIVLENKFSFGNDISPICIDWNSIYNIQTGDLGKIVIWGENEVNATQSPFLLERSFPYIDPGTCQNFYRKNGIPEYESYDMFCASCDCGLNLDMNIGGAGIIFLHSNSYFLTGVLRNVGNEINDTVLGFIDMKYHVQWIRGILNEHVAMNSCVLPTGEGVLYSYEGSNDILSHGTLINHHLTVIENCEVGYHKAYPNSFRFCQKNGKWLSSTEKLCFKMCPPLISDSLDIKCSHNGKYANCSNLSIPDTIATPSCKPTFTEPNEQEISVELLCQSDGLWNKQLYRCNPYCGRVYVKNHVLIDNGDKALVGTAPWNVGIYQLNKIDSNYDMICGGSIISPNLVISAAHCFWQKGMLSKNISITDGLYKIAIGKYDRNLTVIDNEFTEIKNVEMIHLKEDYYGPSGFHAEDIAIIVLQDRVSFNNGVSPVCIDWSGNYNVVNGDQGKIVGWGKTEKGVPSPILLEAYLPYINHSSCRNMYTNGFEPFVTVDKFCAGYALASKQGVSKGDSGAGLCFFHSDSYYLTGVVSIKDPNTNNLIAVFTEVNYHIQWIRGLFNKHNQV
ncbi:unnamed protein product [Macrosiphum euphorbiae]|uniref:Peptidase S1 domain-containing protein n=1 Tax=Macrosiphum euphorbiae TaxID=13131 RepID=A0AAV0XJT7_9HEMI|nr:unnamed protein product [Macrosiphum euphorbiae]